MLVQAVAPTGETTDSRAAADEGGGMSLVVVIVMLVLCCCGGGVLLKAKANSGDKVGDDKPEDSTQSTPSTGTGRGPPPRPPSRPPTRPVRQPCPRCLLRLLHTPTLILACLHFVLTAGQNPLQDDGLEEIENPAAKMDVEPNAVSPNGNSEF